LTQIDQNTVLLPYYKYTIYLENYYDSIENKRNLQVNLQVSIFITNFVPEITALM